MIKARKDGNERPEADSAPDLSRLADASAKLFAGQAAAMAVMTVYGIRMTSELASMMLGALRGPAGDGGDHAAVPEPVEPEPAPKVVPLRPHVQPAAEQAAKAEPQADKSVAGKADARVMKKAPRAKAAARKRPVAKDTASTAADDLKKISGIGPRLEQVLNERGVTRYAHLAGLGEAALKKLDGELGLDGRIIRDDWAGQAKALAGGPG